MNREQAIRPLNVYNMPNYADRNLTDRSGCFRFGLVGKQVSDAAKRRYGDICP